MATRDVTLVGWDGGEKKMREAVGAQPAGRPLNSNSVYQIQRLKLNCGSVKLWGLNRGVLLSKKVEILIKIVKLGNIS